MTESQHTTGEGALAVSLQDLRRVTEVGLERVAGQLSLLVQRLDQADARDAHLGERIDAALSRLDVLERTTVTHDALNSRTARLYVILGLTVAALGVLVPVLVAWLGRH